MESYFYYNSPIGVLEIIFKNSFIISIKLLNNPHQVSKNIPLSLKSQLDEYFLGKRKSFDLPILPSGTDFQKQVWSELQKIPYGATLSYQQVAQNIGRPLAQRAVGSACNKNPILILIPCHRVIAKNTSLAGFACGLNVKKYLLNLENFN